MLVQQEEVLVEWLKYIKGLWIERLHVGILVWEAVSCFCISAWSVGGGLCVKLEQETTIVCV